ncbi:MAG: DM13 domain-containing protein [Candidatus Woesearchaeota archaeon]
MKRAIIAFIIMMFLIGCQPAAKPEAQQALAAAPVPATAPAPVTESAPAPQPAPAEPAQSPYEVMQEVSAASGQVSPGPTTALEPAVLKEGYFHKVVHETNGNVQIARALGGTLSLNLRGFDTEPGPGLTVVLHNGDPANGYVVGTLISHTGNYPYSLPNDFDVNKYTKVAIYNKKYNVVWGEADLK